MGKKVSEYLVWKEFEGVQMPIPMGYDAYLMRKEK